MNALVQIIGEEVIGLPGQNLTSIELFALVSLADGIATPLVAESMNLDAMGMRHVEASILAKLAAKNKVHMITRGFTLGVLIPQALCLFLCFMAVLELNQDFTRPKTQRRSRTLTEQTRCMRNTNSPAGGPCGRQPIYA